MISPESRANADVKRRISARKIGAAGAAGLLFATLTVAPLASAVTASAASAASVARDSQYFAAATAPDVEIHLVASEAEEEALASRGALYTLQQFMFSGVVNWGGYKFTYYSQQVLPGGGLKIPGRHVNDEGYVSDADGYIVLAGSAPLGTVYDTPFGYQGKIYDRGTVGTHLDVYIR